MAKRPLRIGLLGASGIAEVALIAPAQETDDVEIVAVAARDPLRAEAFRARHGIATTAVDYATLITRKDIDLVYISLPNTLHPLWAIAALRAGKHVLLEKPAAPDVATARAMVAVADETGRRLIEAFHYRYHPLFARVLALAQSPEIGRLREVHAVIDVPVPKGIGNSRWDAALGGGALMDLGCYAVHWLRTIAGEFAVTSAAIVYADTGVDESSLVAVEFFGGATGTITCSMVPHARGRTTRLQIIGDGGEIVVRNPIAPQMGHDLRWRSGTEWHDEQAPLVASYTCQLRAVRDALANATALLTERDDIIANAAALAAMFAAGDYAK